VAFRRGQWVRAGVVAAVAVATAVAITLALQPSGSAATGLSAAPLGVNVAPWDGPYTGSSAAAVQPMLSAAGIGQLRYGGGSYADMYDWQTNINVGPRDRRAEPGHGQLRFRHRRAGGGLGERGRADGG
jgi:hypothetical protein